MVAEIAMAMIDGARVAAAAGPANLPALAAFSVLKPVRRPGP